MEKFFDRQGYLDLLEKRIRDLKYGYRQNIAILGDEAVGKSSLIFQFMKKFQDNHLLLFYLEVRPEALEAFAKRFIATLLYNFLLNSGLSLKEDLEFLLKKSVRFIPKTCEKIKFVLAAAQKKREDSIFIELLSLCEKIKEETGKSCVVILDEFHNLESLGIKNLYPQWSKMLVLQKNTLYIIISSLKFKARNILAKNLSLLFGNFQTVVIEPFDVKASESYLDATFKDMALEEGLKNFLVHFTGGHPFYLEIISRAILNAKEKSIPEVLEDLLFTPSGILNQRFSNYLKRFQDSAYSQDYLSLLQLVASGQNKLKEIASVLRKSQREIGLRLNYLLETDSVSRWGDFLKINDRVFTFWLKFVYQEKLSALTFNLQNQKILFRDKLEELLQDFLSTAKKPLPERIAQTLRLFDDEVVQLEKRRLRLNHFREIKPLQFNCPGLKEGLVCRAKDSLWLMLFKYDHLTEEDIVSFSRECKKYRNKIVRKIILTLQDIDANTRLRAMDEKILTWDINRLNEILDLFSQPRVIV